MNEGSNGKLDEVRGQMLHEAAKHALEVLDAMVCKDCKGSGRRGAWTPCEGCNGTGYVVEKEKLDEARTKLRLATAEPICGACWNRTAIGVQHSNVGTIVAVCDLCAAPGQDILSLEGSGKVVRTAEPPPAMPFPGGLW